MSLTVRVAKRAPLADGVKVTVIVQLPAAATLVPQLLVWLKSPGFVPVIAMPEMLSAALPVLLRVIAWAALVELTA